MRRALNESVAALLLLALAPSAAAAQARDPAAAPAEAPASEAPAEASRDAASSERDDAAARADAPLLTQRRERPDYDSRPAPGPDAGEVLLWVPRILLFPVTLVLDYGIRRPLGFLMTEAERADVPALVLDLLTWNERRSGIVPAFLLAYGLQPSAGLLFFSNDEIAQGHSIGASVAFGGVDFLQGGASYAIRMSDDAVVLELRGVGARRPDRVFSGIGWDTPRAQYRFREAWYEATLGLRADFWRESRIALRSGVDGHEFDPNGYAAFSDWPSLESAIQSGAVEAPPGLDRGYVVSRSRAELAIDTREPEPSPGHGVRIDGHVEIAFDLNVPIARRWVRYGGGVGAFLDLGAHRVLGLWGIARFADPLGADELPFTELIALGNEALLMQGFLQGQLRGRSAAAVTLEYRYPIWTRLDGRLHVSVGNVFDRHLRDLALERLRASFGFGIATAGEPDSAFQLAIAAGTAPFVEGSRIDSVQLVFGTRQGF